MFLLLLAFRLPFVGRFKTLVIWPKTPVNQRETRGQALPGPGFQHTAKTAQCK